MTVRLLSTRHLNVHQRATQLVDRHNLLLQRSSDLNWSIGTSTIVMSIFALPMTHTVTPDAATLAVISLMALAFYKYQRQVIKLEWQIGPLIHLRDKNGKHTALVTPSLELVIDYLGEGSIAVSEHDLDAASLMLIAAANPSLEY